MIILLCIISIFDILTQIKIYTVLCCKILVMYSTQRDNQKINWVTFKWNSVFLNNKTDIVLIFD